MVSYSCAVFKTESSSTHAHKQEQEPHTSQLSHTNRFPDRAEGLFFMPAPPLNYSCLWTSQSSSTTFSSVICPAKVSRGQRNRNSSVSALFFLLSLSLSLSSSIKHLHCILFFCLALIPYNYNFCWNPAVVMHCRGNVCTFCLACWLPLSLQTLFDLL